MRVVYSPLHLGHDIVSETVMGLPIPANEVAERAERIRATLEADGGYPIEPPTEHGDAPILAVHDAGLLRFLSEAWSEHRAQGIARPSLIPETLLVRGYVEGMGGEGFTVREPAFIGGRAGFYALDTSTPIVAGTYVAARGVRRRGAHGRRCRPGWRGRGLRAVPAARAPRRPQHLRRLLLLQQRGHRRRTRSPSGPVSGWPILDVDYHHGNGTQQIFYGAATCCTCRSTATRRGSTRTTSATPTRSARATVEGANLNLPLPAGCTNEAYLAALDRGLERDRGSSPARSWSYRWAWTRTGWTRSATSRSRPTGTTRSVDEPPRSAGELVVLQEGGYHRPSLGENVRAWLRGAEGRPYDPMPAAGFTPAGTRG